MRAAIIDDYQNVSSTLADWSEVSGKVEIEVFQDHIDDEGAVAERLKDFEVICIMRERTPLPRQLIENLPNLKLLITSGMRNASIDLAAAADAGVTVCGTGASGYATAELAWSLILALVRNIGIEDRSMREDQARAFEMNALA